jgi:hypothetical protein
MVAAELPPLIVQVLDERVIDATRPGVAGEIVAVIGGTIPPTHTEIVQGDVLLTHHQRVAQAVGNVLKANAFAS